MLRRLVMMVGAYRTAGNTAPTTEWNAAVDPEALAIVIDGWTRAAESDGVRGAPDRARPRRHRAREDDARAPRPARRAQRRCRRATRGAASSRRAALLLRVPQSLRRLLRRLHPRRAGRRGRARPVARAQRGADGRGRAGRPAHRRRDRRPTGGAPGAGRRTSTSSSRRTSRRSSNASSSASARWPLPDRADAPEGVDAPDLAARRRPRPSRWSSSASSAIGAPRSTSADGTCGSPGPSWPSSRCRRRSARTRSSNTSRRAGSTRSHGSSTRARSCSCPVAIAINIVLGQAVGERPEDPALPRFGRHDPGRRAAGTAGRRRDRPPVDSGLDLPRRRRRSRARSPLRSRSSRPSSACWPAHSPPGVAPFASRDADASSSSSAARSRSGRSC